MVVDALGGEEQRRRIAGDQLGERPDRPPVDRGQRAAVDVEADDRPQDALRCDRDRCVDGRQLAAQAIGHLGQQRQAADAPLGEGEQALDRQDALHHEVAALALDPAAGGGLVQGGEVGQQRVGRVGHLVHGHRAQHGRWRQRASRS